MRRRSWRGGLGIVRLLDRWHRPLRRGVLESCFGPLELAVLEVLWKRRGETSVRALQDDFPDTAYTTLMTTLDRLHKKGVLDRRKKGRAYLYIPRYQRHELEARLARDAFDELLADREGDSGPERVLSSFVEAVSLRDEVLLDELERLVRERRAVSKPNDEDGGGGE